MFVNSKGRRKRNDVFTFPLCRVAPIDWLRGSPDGKGLSLRGGCGAAQTCGCWMDQPEWWVVVRTSPLRSCPCRAPCPAALPRKELPGLSLCSCHENRYQRRGPIPAQEKSGPFPREDVALELSEAKELRKVPAPDPELGGQAQTLGQQQ